MINFIGLPEVVEKLEENHQTKPMYTICSINTSTNRPFFPPFLPAQPLIPILKCFNVLHDKYSCDLFRHIWMSKLKEVSNAKEALTFTDVIAKIWVPVFNECCQLIDDVKSLSIKFKDIDHYFGRPERKNIDHQLHLLSRAIDICCEKDTGDFCWIKIAMERLNLYWSLHQQSSAATVVLQLKDSLKLSGDFEVIQSLVNNDTCSMTESSLSDMDQKLQAISFLDNLTSDMAKLESLKKFVSCKNIVEWMRDFKGSEYI